MQGPMIQDQSVTGRELGRDAGGDSDAGESAFGLAIGNGYTRAPQIVQNMLIHSKQVGGHSRSYRRILVTEGIRRQRFELAI